MKPVSPPAFPAVIGGNRYGMVNHPGMTLRDYFAGLMLQATITAYGGASALSESIEQVKIAYAYADEMLRQREVGL